MQSKPTLKQRWSAYWRYASRIPARFWHTQIMQRIKFEETYNTWLNTKPADWDMLVSANDPRTWYIDTRAHGPYGKDHERYGYGPETKEMARKWSNRNPAWNYLHHPDNGYLVERAEKIYYAKRKGENITLDTPPSNTAPNYGKMMVWFLADGKWYFLRARATQKKWFQGLFFWAEQTHFGWYNAGRWVWEIKG